MQERRWNGDEKITMDPKMTDFMRAVSDPNNQSVALVNAPLPGSVVEGRIVTDENRADLVLRSGQRWHWRDKMEPRP